MGSYYTHKKWAPFDSDRVLIYKIKGSPKGSYYVRIKRAGRGKGYWSKTLDCVDERTALKRAKEYWIEMITSEQRGVVYGQYNFSKLFQEFLDSHPFKEDRRNRVVHVYTRYFSEYFGSMPVGSINLEEFKKYLHWRWTYWERKKKAGEPVPGNAAEKPANKTLRSERQLLKQFLTWCKDEHIIDSVPNLPYDFEKLDIPVKQEKSRGKPLSDKHHAAVIRRLHSFACIKEWEAGMSGEVLDADGNVEGSFEPNPMRFMAEDRVTVWARLRLYYFVVITGNLLLRQGTEATKLKWENIEHRVDDKDKRKKYAIIRVMEGKKGRREPVFTPYGRAYAQLVRWHLIAKSFGVGKPGDYVFGDLDGEHIPSHYIGRLHSRCLKKWKLNKHSDNTSVTLYSYRHTAISRRIRKSGWDLLRVAKAANTSALTISMSYADDWMEANKERYTNVFKNPSDLDAIMDKQGRLQSQIEKELEELGVV
jgi:hypothetical protein